VDQVRRDGAEFTQQISAGLHRAGSLYAKAINRYVGPAERDIIKRSYRRFARQRYAGEISDTARDILGSAVDRKLKRQPIDSLELRILDQTWRIHLIDPDSKPATTVGEKIVELLLDKTQPPEFYGNDRQATQVIAARLVKFYHELDGFMSRRELYPLRVMQQQAKVKVLEQEFGQRRQERFQRRRRP